jgi:hypothetical protein
MYTLSRFLLAAALLVATAPLASAQRTTATDAERAERTLSVPVQNFVPLPAPVPENGECYDNGPLFNRPGTGGRPFESVLVGDETTFGYGAQATAGINNEMADDYTVAAGCNQLKGAVFYTYQTTFNSPATSITGYNLNVYADAGGAPNPGAILCSADDPDGGAVISTFTDVYRVVDPTPNSDRRIQRVQVDFGAPCVLPVGQRVWFGIQYYGTLTSGPWQPPVPRPVGSTGCPTLNGLPAQQDINDGGFAPVVNGTCPIDFPFALLSGGAPGALTLTAEVSPASGTYGDEFSITITVTNETDDPIFADFWLETTHNPSGFTYVEYVDARAIPGNFTSTRVITHTIPRNYQGYAIRPGPYTVVVNVGEFATSTVLASDSYDFTVTANRVGAGPAAERSAGTVHGAPASATSAPSEVVVSPNPFAGRATLSFMLAEASAVRLAVYDALGREVAVLVDGRVEAGSHTAVFEAGTLASGTYVYRLVANGQVETGRVTLAR